MKKITLSLLVLTAMMVSSSYAEDPVISPEEPADVNAVVAEEAVAPEVIITGIVQSAVLADASQGTSSHVVVKDINNEDTTVAVKPATSIMGLDDQAIALDQVSAGKNVTVVYTVSEEGAKEAKSIKIVK